ncbi:MAG: TonB-dependent receptor [Pseudomonadota bacterium]
MSRLYTTVSLLAVAGGTLATPAFAQNDEIIVTATKRAESAQDVPVTVNALGEATLEELGVNVFNDYLVQLPGVTAGGGGPGQNTIYIRGVASTTPNLTTAGVAGLAPNVAFYLDEQPLAQPGRNLDVYAADLQRVEVLPGPQGTLFGASSQAGTVRLITNEPKLGVFEARMDAATSFTDGGEMSNKVEAMVNVPVRDKLAVRGVVYVDRQGGFIDNVAGTRTTRDSARFRPTGTVRANGVPVGAGRAGLQADGDNVNTAVDITDFSGINFIEANNTGLVEEDFNDTVYSGARLTALYEFNEDWRIKVAHARQTIEADGVFFDDPELDDYEIQRFADDSIEDDFHNTAWTIEGRVGALEALYTGAYTKRTTEQTVDYTDYLFVGQFLPYYICDGAVTYPGDGAPSGTCQAPNLFVDSSTETEVQTHELRFTTPSEHRLRATFGAFYSDLELAELNDFTYPGSTQAIGFNGEAGFAPNFPLTNTSVTGEIGNAAPGYFSDPGPFPEGVIFRNDILRTDEQFAVFGEGTFEVVPDRLAVTFGARWYDIEVDFEGSANSSFFNFGQTEDAQAFGTNLSAQFAPGNTVGAPDTASTDGVIYKGTVTWTPTSDLLFFATYSEGFRPGLLNRPGGQQGPDGFVVPFEVDTDELTNYELGWKMDLFANQLRFNGSLFYNEIEGLQTTIFDPVLTNLFFSDNAADAEVFGVEGDITWSPASIPGLTVASAFSILDTEVTDVLTPTGDVVEGSPLAFAPEFQGNIRARYEWDLPNGNVAHVQPQIVYSGSSFTDIIEINKVELESWTTLGLRTGITTDKWSAEIFADNLTNERAEISGNFVFDRERITVMRPRTIGLRVSLEY